MTYLDRAIKDGYAIITGPENKQKIIYVTSDNHTENYNDPEEKVRAEFWAELIYEYDYPAHRIKVEVTIPDRVPTDRADIVIFSDDECKKPYAVVECKRDGVTDAEFLQAIEQGVGNATWVKLRASYVVIIAGATRRVLDFSDDSTGILERENNIIADLPKAYGKPQAFRFYRGGEYTDVDGKKKKAPDIQPVAREDLITAIKKCHNILKNLFSYTKSFTCALSRKPGRYQLTFLRRITICTVKMHLMNWALCTTTVFWEALNESLIPILITM